MIISSGYVVQIRFAPKIEGISEIISHALYRWNDDVEAPDIKSARSMAQSRVLYYDAIKQAHSADVEVRIVHRKTSIKIDEEVVK